MRARKTCSWSRIVTSDCSRRLKYQLGCFGAPPTEHLERYKQGATVTIRTKDGRTFSNTVYAPKGAGIHGIDWADVDAKYRTLVPHAQLRDREVDASLQVIHDFRNVAHVSALIDLLQARS